MSEEKLKEIELKISEFRRYSQKNTVIGKDAFYVSSPVRQPLVVGRKLDVTILALTHGNEVAGISVVLEILRLMEMNILKTPFNIGFILGNVEAALAEKRFITSDLNRSFGLGSPHDNPEKLRALELEALFKDTGFLIDLHQTMGPSCVPFLISKLDIPSLSVFRRAMPQCAAVVYQDNFSDTGMTTLNYHLKQGGYGFGVELGKKGFDPWQVEFGVSLVLKSLNFLADVGDMTKIERSNFSVKGPNFTFAETLKGKLGDFKLLENWANMSDVKNREVLGTHLGAEILSPQTGKILFPKYPSDDEIALGGKDPVDICRILRPISETEIYEMQKDSK